ncbi:hypothetical protein [Paracoccus phage vB_PmaS-R3]|uniref:Uncharacterized protein n=1 Tax=Paracoccus phage vB_PmaS-R3 TaxID=2494563 RepID=A0A0B5A0C1_9CAUD|nr:hypothetical protein VC48_gp13 [Paracoccus phage vB_PmaS-R3]AJD83137.1 hypothetical protein [Paracoccus phage vB_PmaS-R3]
MLTDFLHAAQKPDFVDVLDQRTDMPAVYSYDHARAILQLIGDDVRHGRYRAYDLDGKVFGLADSMVQSQWGQPLPFTAFDDETSTVFGMTVDGVSCVLCAVPMADMGQGLLVGTKNPQGYGNAVMARQITDGKLSVVYADTRDLIDGLTDLTAICGVALQLIEGRHVSTQPRTSKHREKVNGKVTKQRAPYTFAYIDVDKDTAANNTAVAHITADHKGKRFHRVRQHLRLQNGKVVSVKAHFRGRGVSKSIAVTKVTASKHDE